MWRSHLSRFDHDWNRGLYRGRIGIIVSDLIRSYLILMSIAAIGLIVENFLAVKNFSTINTIAGTIVTIASDRKSSQQIATDRISSCFQIVVIGVETNSAICCDVLRSPTMCYDLSRFRIFCRARLPTTWCEWLTRGYELMRVNTTRHD